MRVISGKARGTQLVALSGATIRPTLDRVRESFFNQIANEVEGTRFLFHSNPVFLIQVAFVHPADQKY